MGWGLNPRPQRWDISVLPLRHCGPLILCMFVQIICNFCTIIIYLTYTFKGVSLLVFNIASTPTVTLE